MDRQLIIAGFHRSGTSFVTQLLHRAGLFVGDELLGADRSNPFGHFEDVVPFRIHKDILAANGTDWKLDRLRPLRIDPGHWQRMRSFVHQRRASHRLWGFKDPRVCFFLGPWRHLMPHARVLIVFRDPSDAVSSLHRRHAQNIIRRRGPDEANLSLFRDPDLALRMWVASNEGLLVERAAYPENTVVVPLSAVQQGAPLIPLLRGRLGLPLRDVDVREVYDRTVTRTAGAPPPVVDPVLHRRSQRTLDRMWATSDL